MLKAALRWTLIIASLFGVGPLAAMLMNRLHDADGGHAVTVFLNSNLAAGLMAGGALLCAALIVGWIGSQYFSLNTGMATAGFVLAWGRFGEGTLEEIVRRTGNGKDLPLLAAEGVLFVLLGAAMTWLLMSVAHRAQTSPEVPGAASKVPLLITGSGNDKASAVLGMSVLVGALAAAGVAWLLAMSTQPGQTFMAALGAALAAGAASQMLAGSKDFTLSPIAPMLSLALVAVAGPVIAIVLYGQGQGLVEAVFAGKAFPLTRPISLDWVAGGMLGVPVGLGWAGSRLDKRHHQ
jgi:hypothetical protein